MKIGSHITFNKNNNYLLGAIEESINNGANAMMIYLGAPQSSQRVDPQNYFIDEYLKKYRNIISPENIVVHAPYIVNPASLDKYQFAIDFLIQEIKRMNMIGAKYLVLHPGAYTKYNKEESINRLILSIKEIFKNTKDVEILIETMAGKGTEIGVTLEEVKTMIDKINDPRIGVCLDTCHIWDSGIDIKNTKKFIKTVNELNLIEKTKVLHINDSKNDINSKRDRHENIGKGFIGLEPLKRIVNAPEFNNTIMILETPWVDGKTIYKEEINLLIKK